MFIHWVVRRRASRVALGGSAAARAQNMHEVRGFESPRPARRHARPMTSSDAYKTGQPEQNLGLANTTGIKNGRSEVGTRRLDKSTTREACSGPQDDSCATTSPLMPLTLRKGRGQLPRSMLQSEAVRHSLAVSGASKAAHNHQQARIASQWHAVAALAGSVAIGRRGALLGTAEPHAGGRAI